MFVKYSVFITCMYLLRDMPIVICIFFIQIHTFLLFNVLKREVSNVFLYIWTINYSYSYSYYWRLAGEEISREKDLNTTPLGKPLFERQVQDIGSGIEIV